MRKLIGRLVGKRLLRLSSDDALVWELARRLKRAPADGNRIGQLVGQMHLGAAAELVDRLTPVRTMDYARHRIELVVSSPLSAMRLASVEKEPFTVDWIERSIMPGDVFYDVGANVGAYSLIAAKVTENRVRVFAFEPAVPTFHDLSRNVFLNACADSVVPLPLALWSKTGLVSFELRSQIPGASRHRINPESRSEERLVQPVLGIRLDDLVERFGLPVPNHAKIDVDGYELEVLRGAERTLADLRWRSIIIELDREETERNAAIKVLLTESGLEHGHRHTHVASRRYPRPDRRPDVYWTFTREAA